MDRKKDFSGFELDHLDISHLLNLERTTSRFCDILNLQEPEEDLESLSSTASESSNLSMFSVSAIGEESLMLPETENNSRDFAGFFSNPPPPPPSLEDQEEEKNGLVQNYDGLCPPFNLDFSSLQNYAYGQEQNQQHQQQSNHEPQSKSNSTRQKEAIQNKKAIPILFISHSIDQCIGALSSCFVDGEVEKNLANQGYHPTVSILHPDGFMEEPYLKIVISTSSSSSASNDVWIRYGFSFLPTFPGQYQFSLKLRWNHDENVEIENKTIAIGRNYKDIKHHSCNHVRVGFVRHKQPVLIKPWGVAIHQSSNNVYLTSRETHQILVLSSNGIILHQFGEEGNGPGQLCRPTGICIDGTNGRVIVTDKDNHRVSVFKLTGVFLFSFGSKGHQDGYFHYPWGVDVTRDGSLIAVADSRNHRIQMLASNGTFLRKFSIFETSPFDFKEEFNYPRGVCFDNSGKNLFVSDFNLHTVFKLNSELTKKEIMIHQLDRPQGLSVDPAGNILVCDSKSNAVQVFSPSSTYLTSLNISGRDPFICPVDVAVFKDGKIAVVDEEGRFRIF